MVETVKIGDMARLYLKHQRLHRPKIRERIMSNKSERRLQPLENAGKFQIRINAGCEVRAT